MVIRYLYTDESDSERETSTLSTLFLFSTVTTVSYLYHVSFLSPLAKRLSTCLTCRFQCHAVTPKLQSQTPRFVSLRYISQMKLEQIKAFLVMLYINPLSSPQDSPRGCGPHHFAFFVAPGDAYNVPLI